MSVMFGAPWMNVSNIQPPLTPPPPIIQCSVGLSQKQSQNAETEGLSWFPTHMLMHCQYKTFLSPHMKQKLTGI